MQIKSFKFKEIKEGGWEIGPVFLKDINLFVGASGSGKTRTLNSIFNLSRFALRTLKIETPMECQYILKDEKSEFTWDVKVQQAEDKYIVSREKLVEKNLESDEEEVIFDRKIGSSYFLGNSLPKVDQTISLLNILKEEDKIKPVIKLLSSIVRRNFHADDLVKGMGYFSLPKTLEENFLTNQSILKLYSQQANINLILYFLNKYEKEKFNQIMQLFTSLFENITDSGVDDINAELPYITSNEPVMSFWIKEKNVNDKIYTQSMSSGMQKVLMIITDIIALPDDIIYLIDEYENSLGVNAIDVLPLLMSSVNLKKQLMITTHHPYLINKIAVKNWILFNRDGSKINCIPGEELEDKYGTSKQESFIKLINDPLYTMEEI